MVKVNKLISESIVSKYYMYFFGRKHKSEKGFKITIPLYFNYRVHLLPNHCFKNIKIIVIKKAVVKHGERIITLV